MAMLRDELRARWEETIGSGADLDSLDLQQTFKDAWAPMPVQPHPSLEQGIKTVELIGSGGVGEVFRAHQGVLERDVALKQLKPDAATSPNKRAEFLAECIANGRLEHPNIVPVYALGENPDTSLFLAMKLVEGQTWKALLRGPRRDDLAFNLDILIQVCNAVAYAHSRSIVHNDLKPGNVMLGPFGEVLVLDWGLAVDVRPAPDLDSRVRHKSAIKMPCGTPSYMAPELAMGAGVDIGPWTDVYLLGAILFEILTGLPPHKGSNIYDVVARVISGEGVSLPETAPRGLREICLQALQLKPEDRPSVPELQQCLRDFLRHRESHKIAEHARRQLESGLAEASASEAARAERTRLYEQFSEAVSGFRQALQLWQENPQAAEGEQEARRAYAQTALQLGDLGLAEAQCAQLQDGDPANTRLRAAVVEAGRLRQRELRTRTQVRRGLVAAVVCLIIGLSGGLYALYLKNLAIAEEKQRVVEKSQTIAAQNLTIAAEKQQVERQRQYADERGDIAQEALDNLVEGVQQRLLRSLGDRESVEVARGLLHVALRGWEKMLAANVDRGVATLGRARAELNVGMLIFELDGSIERSGPYLERALQQLESLAERDRAWWKLYGQAQRALARNDFAAGRTQRALVRHRACIDGLAALLAADPGDDDLAGDLASSLRRMSQLQLDFGDVPAARAACEEALSICARGLRNDPGNLELTYDLASTLGSLSTVLYREGQLAEAEVRLRESLRLRRALLAQLPASSMLRSDLGEALTALGSLLLDLYRLEEALALLHENLQVQRELLALDSGNAARRQQLATSLSVLGEVHERLDQLEPAAGSFAECVALRRTLLALDSTGVRAQRELAAELGNHGRVLHGLGRLQAAESALREAYETILELVGRVPESADLRRDLALISQASGMLQASLGDLPGACARLEDASAVLGLLLEDQPQSYDLRRARALCENQLADVLAARGSLADAVARGEASLELWRELLASGADNPRTLPEAAGAFTHQAQRLMGLQQVEAGLECFEQSVQILMDLVGRRPGDRNAMRQLAVVLEDLAEIYMVQDRWPEAAERAAPSIEIWRTLLAVAPDDLDDLSSLAGALRVAAQIAEVRGLDQQALEQQQEALDLAERLCAAQPGNEAYSIKLSRIAYGLGLQYEKAGQLEQALACLERAVACHAALDGSDPEIRAQQQGLGRERDRLRLLMQSGDLLDGSRPPANPEEFLLLASQRWQEGKTLEAYEAFTSGLAASEPEDGGVWAQAADAAAMAISLLEGEDAVQAEQRALAWLERWLDVLFAIRDEAQQGVFRGGGAAAREQLESIEGMLGYFRRQHPAMENLRGKPAFEQLFER